MILVSYLPPYAFNTFKQLKYSMHFFESMLKSNMDMHVQYN